MRSAAEVRAVLDIMEPEEHASFLQDKMAGADRETLNAIEAYMAEDNPSKGSYGPHHQPGMGSVAKDHYQHSDAGDRLLAPNEPRDDTPRQRQT